MRIEPFSGERSALRSLFELAEDSGARLDRYIELGVVFVALDETEAIVGHIQLVFAGRGKAELKNMAVLEEAQGQGIGRALCEHAFSVLKTRGCPRVLVATAAADVGNLRFYQRQGFRMLRIVRDVFSEANGYPPVMINGIPLRDQIWLDRMI